MALVNAHSTAHQAAELQYSGELLRRNLSCVFRGFRAELSANVLSAIFVDVENLFFLQIYLLNYLSKSL